MESRSAGVFVQNEADIAMIWDPLMVAEFATPVVRILSFDTDVFVLLFHWVYRHGFQVAFQIARWDGTLWYMHPTCIDHGLK